MNKGKGGNSLVFELDDNEHARMRRDVSHAFSSASLRAQEPIITKHVNRLVSLMKSHTDQAINMTDMFNSVTFDIAGDVTFGDSFGCLDDATFHGSHGSSTAHKAPLSSVPYESSGFSNSSSFPLYPSTFDTATQSTLL